MEIMDTTPLDDIADIPNIIQYSEKSLELARNSLPTFEGSKEAKIERVIGTLLKLNRSLSNIDLASTSFDVLQDIRALVVKLVLALQRQSREYDFSEIQSLVEGILAKLPLISPDTGQDFAMVRQDISNQREAFLTDRDYQIKEVKEAAINAVNKIEEKVNEIDALATKQVAEISNSIAKVSKLAHLVAGAALNNSYSDQAINHKSLSQWWTVATGALGVATLALLTIFFLMQLGLLKPGGYELPPSSLDIPLITTKVLITLTFGLLTRWASKRANYHLAQMARYRRLELNLASLDSFVAVLDPLTKDRVMAFVTAKLLTEDSTGDPNSEFDSISVDELLKQIVSRSSFGSGPVQK